MVLHNTRTHVQSRWKACNLRIRNRKWTYKEKMREWSKGARHTEIEKTGYESISTDHAVTALISFHCLKAKKKNKMRIHPISGHSPFSYEFLPDGNLSLENEDMSGKMWTYGTPSLCTCPVCEYDPYSFPNGWYKCVFSSVIGCSIREKLSI
jgi:hypothetical protein